MAHATALPGRRQPGVELAVHELAVHGNGREARGGGDLGDGGRLLGGGARGAGSARRGWRWEDGAAEGGPRGRGRRARASVAGAEELGRTERRRRGGAWGEVGAGGCEEIGFRFGPVGLFSLRAFAECS